MKRCLWFGSLFLGVLSIATLTLFAVIGDHASMVWNEALQDYELSLVPPFSSQFSQESKNGALKKAIRNKNIDQVKSALHAGAEANACDHISEFPLKEASGLGLNDIVELLIAHKAEINRTNNRGATALHTAAIQDYVETARILITHNATVDAQTDRGITPLMTAIQFRSIPLLCMLIEEFNASKEVCNNAGYNAQQWAEIHHHTDIAALIPTLTFQGPLIKNAGFNAPSGDER